MTATSDATPALFVERLAKSFTGPDGAPLPVIRLDRLMIRAGEQVGLRAPSGAGKTTLLHLISGILRADAGTIRIAGREMPTRDESACDRLRAERVGYVFQTFNLLQGYTALENVLVAMLFADRVDRERAELLLRATGLGDRLHHRPRQLSAGQQQRVAIARALANRPALVLADEPTGNLDERTAHAVLTTIVEACRDAGAALLMASHDRSLLSRLDRVVDLTAVNQPGTALAAAAPEAVS